MMVKESEISKHGLKRLKERLSVGKGAADRQVKLALERGIYYEESSGRLHKWITSNTVADNRYAYRYVIYNRRLFIFSSEYERLITIYGVPRNLYGLIDCLEKKRKKKGE